MLLVQLHGPRTGQPVPARAGTSEVSTLRYTITLDPEPNREGGV
jgi:hypothetical protein